MVSAIDSTLQQFSADALLVVLIVLNAFLGWRTGTMRRVLAMVGLYVAFLGAYYTGNGFATFFRKGDIFANAWAFVAILAVVVVLFELMGAVLAGRIKLIATMAFDRVLGAVVGGAVGFFQAAVLFWIALAVGAANPSPGSNVPASRDSAANAVRSATLASHASGVQPLLRDLFSPLITTDLTTHLESGTQLVSLHF
jgi:Colicin V production protein